jgi:hypothetical protein
MRLVLPVGPEESSMHGLWLEIGARPAPLPLLAGNVIWIAQAFEKGGSRNAVLFSV